MKVRLVLIIILMVLIFGTTVDAQEGTINQSKAVMHGIQIQNKENCTKQSLISAGEHYNSLPPTSPISSLPYDPSYAPSHVNCEIYQSPLAKKWFTFSYRHNAKCACQETPNEPHNNCVRKCLQVKMKAHLANLSKPGAALPLTFPGEAYPMCHDMWQQHVECYKECGCTKEFIIYPMFSTMCRMPFPCRFVGNSIDWFNSCVN